MTSHQHSNTHYHVRCYGDDQGAYRPPQARGTFRSLADAEDVAQPARGYHVRTSDVRYPAEDIRIVRCTGDCRMDTIAYTVLAQDATDGSPRIIARGLSRKQADQLCADEPYSWREARAG